MLWEGLCIGFSVGRVLGKLLRFWGRGRRSEGFFRDAKMRMGLAWGGIAENKLTWVVEFPILLRLYTLLRHRNNAHHSVIHYHSRSPALCCVMHRIMHNDCLLKPRIGGRWQSVQIK